MKNPNVKPLQKNSAVPHNNPYPLSFWIGGILAFVAILLGMILEGGHVSSIIVPSAWLMIIGGGVAYAIAAFPFSTIGQCLGFAFSRNFLKTVSPRTCGEFYHRLGDAWATFGLLYTMMGLVHVMENLDKPESIGPGIAFSFVGAFWGYLFQMLIAVPLGNRALVWHSFKATKEPIGESASLLGVRLVLATILGTLLLSTVYVMEGGHLNSLIQDTSALIVGAGALGAALMSIPLLGRLEGEVSRIRRYAVAMSAAASGSVMAGLIGCIMGLVIVMENLGNPDMIGPGVAIAFVASIYGCLGFLVFSAVEQAFKGRVLDHYPVKEFDHRPIFLAGSMSLLLFSVFMILYALKT